MRRGDALLREEMAAAEKRGTERLEKTEARLVERVDRILVHARLMT